MLRDFDGRGIPGTTRGNPGLGSHVDASSQERAGSEDDCPGTEAATVRGLHALQLIAFDQEPRHHALRKLEVRERLEELPQRALVEGTVALRPRRPPRRSLGAV